MMFIPLLVVTGFCIMFALRRYLGASAVGNCQGVRELFPTGTKRLATLDKNRVRSIIHPAHFVHAPAE